eukprot:6501211-Karenia_brevis.AAC.1
MVALSMPPVARDRKIRNAEVMDATLARMSQILQCSPSLTTVEKMMDEVSQIIKNITTPEEEAEEEDERAAEA